MKEVFPGDSVHSLLSILDVITVPAPKLAPDLAPQSGLSPGPLTLMVAVPNLAKPNRGCPQTSPGPSVAIPQPHHPHHGCSCPSMPFPQPGRGVSRHPGGDTATTGCPLGPPAAVPDGVRAGSRGLHGAAAAGRSLLSRLREIPRKLGAGGAGEPVPGEGTRGGGVPRGGRGALTPSGPRRSSWCACSASPSWRCTITWA